MSLGVMSGVNWMRLNEQSSDFASAEASVVLPTPGTSSMSTWPRQSTAIIISSTAFSLPTMTFPTLFCKSCAKRCVTCMGSASCPPVSTFSRAARFPFSGRPARNLRI